MTASEEELLQAAEAALTLLTSLREDAFCDSVIMYGSQDRGSYWANTIICQLQLAIDQYKTERQRQLEEPIMARIREWLR